MVFLLSSKVLKLGYHWKLLQRLPTRSKKMRPAITVALTSTIPTMTSVALVAFTRCVLDSVYSHTVRKQVVCANRAKSTTTLARSRNT
eukprot:5417326-Amphidinium_carterae.1